MNDDETALNLLYNQVFPSFSYFFLWYFINSQSNGHNSLSGFFYILVMAKENNFIKNLQYIVTLKK